MGELKSLGAELDAVLRGMRVLGEEPDVPLSEYVPKAAAILQAKQAAAAEAPVAAGAEALKAAAARTARRRRRRASSSRRSSRAGRPAGPRTR